MLNNLAVFYTNERRFTEAEKIHLRALAIRENLDPPPLADIAQSKCNLAVVYHSRGDYAKAAELYQASLEDLGTSEGQAFEGLRDRCIQLCRPFALDLARYGSQPIRGSRTEERSGVTSELLSFYCLRFDLAGGWHPRIVRATGLLAWRNWHTCTAQDRMGKPVEVRVLSRAGSEMSERAAPSQSERARSEPASRRTTLAGLRLTLGSGQRTAASGLRGLNRLVLRQLTWRTSKTLPQPHWSLGTPTVVLHWRTVVNW